MILYALILITISNGKIYIMIELGLNNRGDFLEIHVVSRLGLRAHFMAVDVEDLEYFIEKNHQTTPIPIISFRFRQLVEAQLLIGLFLLHF